MKILICGDSFCVTDPKFPGLHWSEKLLQSDSTLEIVNMSYGGCSNALIAFQMLQGLKLKPNFVILSFTSPGRYEYDKNVEACPYDLTEDSLSAYIKERYTTNMYKQNKKENLLTDQWITSAASENFEKLKNYFFIDYCLTLLQHQGIKFCYSLGGFSYKQDYTELINSNFIKNTLNDVADLEIPINLWYHTSFGNNEPFFHVNKEEVQTLFANECRRRITESQLA